jgi:PhnB protein
MATKKKTGAKKTSAKKTSAKKSGAKKSGAKKSGAKKSGAKKAGAKKAGAKKSTRVVKRGVEAVPSRYGTVTPHLIVSPCREALLFYARAFRAKDLGTMDGPDGVVMHGEMQIGDSIIMVSDEMPPMPGEAPWRKTPKSARATTGGIMLYVPDVDAVYARAVDAGARGVMPPTDMFWGDRYAQVEDPYGHVWAMATHVKDVSRDEMVAAMESQGPPA